MTSPKRSIQKGDFSVISGLASTSAVVLVCDRPQNLGILMCRRVWAGRRSHLKLIWYKCDD
ncbi:hypothetical protein LAY57_22315 [Argonema antarcticum A004/B2]|nr:hypothetical protein [Argonema antarcticum A004/B2]